MSTRTRYALQYRPTDGASTAPRTLRGVDEAGAAAALLEGVQGTGQGITGHAVGDALAGLAIGARESITVRVQGCESLTVTLDADAPSAEDARIAEDAAQWRRSNGTASAADWRGAGDYVVTNAPAGERLHGLRRMSLEEATRVASFGQAAGFASRVERIGADGMPVLEASGADAAHTEPHADGLPQPLQDGTADALAFLARFGITLPSAEQTAARLAEHRATVQARLDAEHTASSLLAHLVSMRRLEATASALVDALDSDYSSTVAERNAAAARLAIRTDARQFAERVEAFVVRGERPDGHRLTADEVEAWRPVLAGGAAGTYAPSVLAAIRNAVAR